MQDRNDGFKTHHRIAAAKELIVHIVRDEQPASVHPEPVEGSELVAGSTHPEPRQIVVPAEAGTQGGGGGRSAAANSARTEPVLSTAEEPALPSLPQLTTNNQQLKTLPARRPRTRRSRQGRHSRKGVRAQRRGSAGQARPRGAHPRRAQNQGETRTALARAGPLWRAHRLHTPRPLTTPVNPNPTTQPNSERGSGCGARCPRFGGLGGRRRGGRPRRRLP